LPSDLRLHTDRLGKVSLTGAVSSHQADASGNDRNVCTARLSPGPGPR